MKTRFDNTAFWFTSNGNATKITEMNTDHLMNVLRMFIKKPSCIVDMIVVDIEREDNEIWSPKKSAVKTASITTVTSMTESELIEYALESPLGKSIWNELTDRGVNVENVLTIAFNATRLTDRGVFENEFD